MASSADHSASACSITLPARAGPNYEILPAATSEDSSFHKTGSLRIGYSKLEEKWFRNLESRAKNVPCAFSIISKQEARELSTEKNEGKTGSIGSINGNLKLAPVKFLLENAPEHPATLRRKTQTRPNVTLSIKIIQA